MAVRTVLRRVLVLNVIVAAIKIVVGAITGTVSILADGFHSVIDGASNIVGLVALRYAAAPPDSEHPYGHRKAETIATLLVGGALILAAIEIVEGSVGRLIAGASPQVSPISFAIMAATIVVNLAVSTYERARARSLSSDFLAADARHTMSDVWVSSSVIAGLIGVSLGVGWLDSAVGIGIAGIIAWSALLIVRRAINVLMDAAVLPGDEVARLALEIPEVESVERIRSRGIRDDVHVDLHVRVKADTPTDYAHSIVHAVQHRISAAFPRVTDITIHTEPALRDGHSPDDMRRRLKSIAHSLGGSAHEIWMHSVGDEVYVELHLEVPPRLTLAAAHDLATALEERGRHVIPRVREITTHIEPLGEAIRHETSPLEADSENDELVAAAQKITDSICGSGSCHHVYLWPVAEKLGVSMHVAMDPSVSIVVAHATSARVERALRAELPVLDRVTVHVEPRT